MKLWYNKNINIKGEILMKNLRKQLIELLNIHGVSGQETEVRSYLKPILEKQMDSVKIDTYGNLLATKTIGNGQGATILLSAHMDTVKGVLKDRKLIEKNGVISSSKGALGADDRAGIAIILTVLENINKLGFDGTIKVAFSREEEIGCVGSSNIDPHFYEDVDLAIVVDRRGNRDIVVGCGQAFCSDEVGLFMEDVAKMADMPDWRAVEGGVSDALIFSENGVNSINLSAGYRNEHTEKEYVVLSDMKDTTKLILQAIAIINQFFATFGQVPRENRWAKAWKSFKGYSKSYGSYSYYEDSWDDMIYAEEFDINGDIFVYEIGKDVIIQQGSNEILLSRESLRGLVDQLKDVL
jgi:putative aminopeptidase FrvX